MKHPYLFSDLDQTLLQHNKKISSKNYELIKKFVANKGILIFVTGRSLERTQVIADLVFQKTGYQVPYFVCFAGSLIYDNINKQVLFTSLINPKLAQGVYDFSLNHKFGIWPYNNAFLNEQRLQIKNVSYWWLIKIWHKNYTFETKKQILDNQGVFKINILSPKLHKKIPSSFYQDIKKTFANQLDVIFTSNRIIEITNKGINKGSAIRWLCEYLKIPLSQTASIGDSMNDVPMFEITDLRAAAKVRDSKILNFVDKVINKKSNRNSVALFIEYLLKEL
ncbi:HAD family hydrolase [Ureaplasma sp. ES3154-GEN]|uniref:HAD family hydrolase n=1 Tax=Ureaplasma sp. ES3154-GEN TaxID=2984844 RepID=UPI0021E8AD9D|nr:HAD family hydrolase [Ureaplasma sp. ES3154-GEN]MCV3743773.1 HAD family hydrolase [Ureaplasma sp. ES3154-GEN]